MMRCGLYTFREEQNSTQLAANAFDEDVVAAKRGACMRCARTRVSAAARSISAAVCYFWAPRLLLATTGNGKRFASPETCAEVRRSKKMHLLHQAWVSLLLLLLPEQLLGRCNGR